MTSTSVDEALRAEIDRWHASGLGRELRPAAGVDFCTNDYLGLAGDMRLVGAARVALGRHGVGAKAARLLAGHGAAHAAAEYAAAAWLGTERALLFPSGYHANVALLQALTGPGDVVLSDARNHASIIDGTRLARSTTRVFEHNDMRDLERLLARLGHHRARIIVVESVYSTDGTLAPLEDLAALAERHDARLLVDEAHAGGLYGPQGAGRAAGLRCVLARTVTGGKALGVAGAFVAGSAAVVETLVHKARSFVFTTAPMPALAAALERAIAIVRAESGPREAAHEAARALRARLATHGIAPAPGGPIVFVPLGAAPAAAACAAAIQAEGYDVRAIRPPTVPEGCSGLRLVCHANHTPAQIEGVAGAIARAWCPAVTTTAARAATPLLVVGTDTDVGKTVVSALLVRAARRAGMPVHYWKPLQTGADDDTARVRTLAAPDDAPPPAVSLTRPASIDHAAADEGVEVRAAHVLSAARSHLTGTPAARWVFETAGGLRVPLNAEEDQADWLAALRAPTVLVGRSGLGTLNHTLLTVEALERRRIAIRALFLVGPTHADNERTLRSRLPGVPVLCLPWWDAVDTDALDDWLDGRDLEGLWP